METLDYISPDVDSLLEDAPDDIKTILAGDDVNHATSVLGKIYKLPISSYVGLSNIITFILLGALKPEDAVRGIKDILDLDEDMAYKLAGDLDKTILEKARIKILGKAPTDMVTLTFQEGRTPNELREEILDTTKRGSVLPPEQPEKTPTQATKEALALATQAPVAAPQTESKSSVIPGSRSALMEQLNMLGAIPDDDEVAERIKKIQEQISGIKGNDRGLESPIALQEFMPKSEDAGAVSPEEKTATYSKAPTKYNVDPYREISEE
jgi:hypothetical protein